MNIAKRGAGGWHSWLAMLPNVFGKVAKWLGGGISHGSTRTDTDGICIDGKEKENEKENEKDSKNIGRKNIGRARGGDILEGFNSY